MITYNELVLLKERSYCLTSCGCLEIIFGVLHRFRTTAVREYLLRIGLLATELNFFGYQCM